MLPCLYISSEQDASTFLKALMGMLTTNFKQQPAYVKATIIFLSNMRCLGYRA